MPRIYGYMDTDTNVFTPAGQEVQYNPPQGQVAYSAYNQQPQGQQPQGQQWQGQGYRANTGRQQQYQQWQGNGYRVNVGQPRFSGNGYAPRPRYEFMPNSRGEVVATPIYDMNNSAVPVRVGSSPDGQLYGSVTNYQAVMPRRQMVQRGTTGTVLGAGINYPHLGIYWDAQTQSHVSGTPRARDLGDTLNTRTIPVRDNPQPVPVSTSSVASTQQQEVDPMTRAYRRVFGEDLTGIDTNRFFNWLGTDVQDPKRIRAILSGEEKLDERILNQFRYNAVQRFLNRIASSNDLDEALSAEDF